MVIILCDYKDNFHICIKVFYHIKTLQFLNDFKCKNIKEIPKLLDIHDTFVKFVIYLETISKRPEEICGFFSFFKFF